MHFPGSWPEVLIGVQNNAEDVPPVYTPVAHFVRHLADEIDSEPADFAIHDIGCSVRIRERQDIERNTAVRYLDRKVISSAAAHQFDFTFAPRIGIMADIDERLLYGYQEPELSLRIETAPVRALLNEADHRVEVLQIGRSYQRL